MKKLLLAFAALLLAGCAAAPAPEPTAAPTAAPTPEAAQLPEAAPEPVPDEALAAIVEAMYEKNPVELMMVETRAVDLADESWLRYNTGLELADAEKVDAAVLSEPMTGSQAFSLVLVRLKDAADAEEIANKMLENIDPVKWVCVAADDERVIGCGDLVLFVMADSGLGMVDGEYTGGTAVWKVAETFLEVVGAEADFDISKGAVE